jgi:hypothetical protein
MLRSPQGNYLLKWIVFFVFNLQALHRLSITPLEYEAMLALVPLDSSIEHIESTACDWLKANEDIWLHWMPQEDNERTKILIGGIFPMGGKVYTARGIMAG